MRRLCLLIAIGLIITTILLGTIADSFTIKRHISPTELPQIQLNPVALYSMTKLLASSLTNENYEDLKTLASLLKNIHTTGTTKVLINQLSELIQNQSEAVSFNKLLLEEIKNAINSGNLNNTDKLIEEARKNIILAITIQQNLYKIANGIDKSFKTNVTELVKLIDEVILSQTKQIEELDSKLALMKEKPTCKLNIILDKSEAWVGEQVSINVSAEHEVGITSKGELTIYLEANNKTQILEKTVFPLNMKTTFSIKLPYIYVKTVKIYATLLPIDNEFSPCSSNILYLNLKWITPNITIYLNDSVITPTSSFSMVIENNHSEELKTTIELPWGKIEASIKPGQNVLEFFVPSYLQDGTYTIKLFAHPNGIIGPLVSTTKLRIERLKTNVVLDEPRIIVAGLPTKINVCVTGENEEVNNNHLKGIILVSMPGSSTITSIDGLCKQIGIRIPITTGGGKNNITVVFEPSLPMYSQSVYIGTVTVFNPLILLVGFSIFIISVKKSLNYMKIKPLVIQPGAKRDAVVEYKEKLPNKYEPRDTPIYVLLKVMEKLSGIPRQPHETLREYYKQIKSRLGNLASIIEAIMIEVEKSVYGIRKTPDWVLHKLRELLSGER